MGVGTSKGYFVYRRELVDYDIFWKNPDYLVAYMFIVAQARYEENEHSFFYKGVQVTIGLGEYARSVRDLTDDLRHLKWKKHHVDSFLKVMKRQTLLQTENRTGVNVLIVCKYKDYHSFSHQPQTAHLKHLDQSSSSPQTHTNKLRNIKQETNKSSYTHSDVGNWEDFENKVVSNDRSDRTTCTEYHTTHGTAEWINWCTRELGWGEARAHDKLTVFRDYWAGRSGDGARKSDWPSTWRSWCRKEGPERSLRQSQGTGSQQRVGPFSAAVREVMAERGGTSPVSSSFHREAAISAHAIIVGGGQACADDPASDGGAA